MTTDGHLMAVRAALSTAHPRVMSQHFTPARMMEEEEENVYIRFFILYLVVIPGDLHRINK